VLTIHDPAAKPLCDGITRREWLHIGGLAAAGLSMPGWLAAKEKDPSRVRRRGSARACIFLFMYGGPSQLDTWDPKPDAPVEIRGEIGSIPTRVGIRVSELMPRTASLLHRCCVVRSMNTRDNAHASSGYMMHAGVEHLPKNVEFPKHGPPNDAPCLGSMIRYLSETRQTVLPAAATLGELMYNDGPTIWPGQGAGALGRRFDPWLLKDDPAAPGFQVPGMWLPDEVSHLRLDGRQSILAQLQGHLDKIERDPALAEYALKRQQAAGLLTSSKTRQAFEIDREPDRVRDRYGRNRFGQSLLLARRLVQAGVSLVQVNWPRSKDSLASFWDTHGQNAMAMKTHLMPVMDQGYSALLEDLAERGLLDETLVVWVGEMGRSPKINKNGGRDHWGSVFSAALAGGGVRGGHVHGASDRIAAQVKETPVEPQDLLATIFHCLGINPGAEIRDSLGRPRFISNGKILQPILA
jgi:hypothetical protein